MSTYVTHHRDVLHKLYHHLYSRDLLNGQICLYCGDFATTRDHVPSLHSVDLISTEKLRELQIPLLLIPSCSSCNIYLGGLHVITLLERTEYIEQRLNAVYEKRPTPWTLEELATVKPMFRQMFSAKDIITRNLLARIRFSQARICELELQNKQEMVPF